MDAERRLEVLVIGMATGVAFGLALRAMRWLWSQDPDLARLAAAPPDDEPVAEEDIEAVQGAKARAKVGHTVPFEQVVPELAGSRR